MIGFLLLSLLSITATANDIPGSYKNIAHRERVPVDIWFALLQQESCIQLETQNRCLPWPWTLNIDRKPYRLKSREQALGLLNRAVANELPVAIGIGQIYWPAHYDQFDSPELLLNIEANLSYSARWLRKQYDVSGDWWVAVGRYHAPNDPVAAEGYRKRVYRRWEAL